MIFPLFLFLAGFSMVCSFVSRTRRGEAKAGLARHVLVRSVELLALSLPFECVPAFNWHQLHVLGVLQRIAPCYLVGGLLIVGSQKGRSAFQVDAPAVTASMVLLLVGIWVAVRFVQVPGYGSWAVRSQQ